MYPTLCDRFVTSAVQGPLQMLPGPGFDFASNGVGGVSVGYERCAGRHSSSRCFSGAARGRRRRRSRARLRRGRWHRGRGCRRTGLFACPAGHTLERHKELAVPKFGHTDRNRPRDRCGTGVPEYRTRTRLHVARSDCLRQFERSEDASNIHRPWSRGSNRVRRRRHL